jgi:gluconokinase
LTEGGSVFAWLVSLMHLQPGQDLEAALNRLPADGHGLTFLPLISGERSPGWRGDARGVVAGLSLSTTSLELLLAGLEGVAYRVAQVYDLLRPMLPDDPEVIASGGALMNSPVWTRILADTLGQPVTESRVEQVTARGAALLALEALHLIADISQAPGYPGVTYQPDNHRHATYRAAMRRQQELYRYFSI